MDFPLFWHAFASQLRLKGVRVLDLLSDEGGLGAYRAVSRFLELNGRNVFPDAHIFSLEDSVGKVNYGLSRVISGRLSDGNFYGVKYHIHNFPEMLAIKCLSKLSDSQREVAERTADAFVSVVKPI